MFSPVSQHLAQENRSVCLLRYFSAYFYTITEKMVIYQTVTFQNVQSTACHVSHGWVVHSSASAGWHCLCHSYEVTCDGQKGEAFFLFRGLFIKKRYNQIRNLFCPLESLLPHKQLKWPPCVGLLKFSPTWYTQAFLENTFYYCRISVFSPTRNKNIELFGKVWLRFEPDRRGKLLNWMVIRYEGNGSM